MQQRKNSGRARIPLLLVMLFCLLPLQAQAVDADGTLVFGFLPILSTQKLVIRFKPMVDLLAGELHQPIRMETAPSYIEFLKRTRAKRYDIIFTAPHLYYLAHEQSGYNVIVRVNAKELKAIIVATKASHITNLRELKGKKLATPDRLSLGAALIRNSLRRAGLDPDKDVTIIATPSHNAALLTAYNGIADAAGLMVPPYTRASEDVHKAMVTLGVTAGTAHMPIAVSASLDPALANKIADVLVSLSKTEKGQAVLKHLAWPMGFVKAKNSEYAPLKDIVTELHLE
jgi:phosphonate transport system substrate-binding protein